MDNEQLTIHEAIERNHWKEALELINQAQPDELNATNELGQTPLHLAIAAKDLNNEWIYETGGHGTNVLMSIINALIERGASVNAQDKDGEAPVHYISKWLLVDKNNGKVKSELVNCGDYIYDNVLMLALQCLIKNRIDINIEDKEGNTALDNIIKAKWFSTKGFYGGQSALSVIKTLLDAGAHIKDQEQALRIFAGSIAYSDVRWLKSRNYKEGDDIKIRDLVISNGITSVGNEVRREIDINYKDKKGNTALSLAYEEKKLDVIKFLIEEKGANTNIIIPSTKKGFMTHVIEDNLFDLVPSLKFDAVRINGFPPIVTAMRSGNYDSFLTLIKKHKADISFSNVCGEKAIHYAAVGGSTKILEYLINHGADVNSFNVFGDTALHHAAIGKDGNENIAFLIQNGIDVNCQNKGGIRPILFAIKNNHPTNLQMLLDNGASLEMKDFEEMKKIDPSIVVTLLRSKNYSVVQDLLESKRTNLDEILKVPADPNGNKSYTILHWAAIHNKPDVFAALELYIKDVHINDKGRVEHTPLHFAVHNNNVDVVKILLKIPDIDINASLGSNYLPNSSIGCARNAKMVFMLIEAGADIESEQGKRDLAGVINQLIGEGKNEEIITLLSHALLKDKIDFNIEAWHRGHDGITILRAAASEHNTKLMILLILLFDADLTLTDNHGKKPLDYLNDPKLKKYLEEDVAELRDNINKICGTSATDFILPYLKDNSDISTTLKSLNQLIKILKNAHLNFLEKGNGSLSKKTLIQK